MKLAETEDMWGLSCAWRLTIPEIKTAAAELCPAIDADVKRAGMVAQEPWIFVAENLPKNGKTQFNWRCCRPVAELLDYQAPFELRLMQVNVGHPGLP